MSRTKRKKQISSCKGILKGIARAEEVSFDLLESFLSLPCQGDEREVKLLMEVVKYFTFRLSKKYWDNMESERLTNSIRELNRITHSIQSGTIPK